jgi:hypothetical protein
LTSRYRSIAFDREQLAAGRPDYWLETIDQLLPLLNVQSMEARRG